MNEGSYAASETSRARPRRRWYAALRGVLVFSAFFVFGLLEPAQHEARAVVGFDAPAVTSNGSPDVVKVAGVIADSLSDPVASFRAQVEAIDSRSFHVIVRDENAERAKATCTRVAEQVARRANEALAPDRDAPATEADRELEAYLVAHPPSAATSLQVTERPGRTEAERIRLQIERAHVQADLNKAQNPPSPAAGENPFAQQAPTDTRLLKRRLAEIDGLLAAPPKQSVPSNEDPELRLRVEAVRTKPAAESAPTTHVHVLDGAALVPSTPGSNPTLLHLFGGFAAVLTMLMPSIGRGRRAGGRRTEDTAHAPLSAQPARPGQAGASEGGEPGEAPRGTGASGSGFSLMAYPVSFKPDPRIDPKQYAPLCAELAALGVEDCFVVAVVGAATAADIKPLFATSLAVGIAADEQLRVLLLEADLSHPTLQRALRIELPPDTDFAAQLNARLAGGSENTWYVLKCTPTLHVLLCAKPAPELLLSTHFEACIRELRAYYDVILLHGPSVVEKVSCRAIDDLADGVLLARAPADSAAVAALGLFGGKSLLTDVVVS